MMYAQPSNKSILFYTPTPTPTPTSTPTNTNSITTTTMTNLTITTTYIFMNYTIFPIYKNPNKPNVSFLNNQITHLLSYALNTTTAIINTDIKHTQNKHTKPTNPLTHSPTNPLTPIFLSLSTFKN